MRALFAGWSTNSKVGKERPLMTKNKIRKKEKRKRLKLYETVAREQREIQEMARKGAAAVMERLQAIAENSPNETAAISAGLVILDRGYGKATQTNVNATLDANGKATDVSGKELDARIQKVIERLEGITGGTPKAPKSKDKPVDLRKLDRDPNSTPLN
jgi:PAS domain-containing protein